MVDLGSLIRIMQKFSQNHFLGAEKCSQHQIYIALPAPTLPKNAWWNIGLKDHGCLKKVVCKHIMITLD